jgi:hypothetical protein
MKTHFYGRIAAGLMASVHVRQITKYLNGGGERRQPQ